MWQALGLEFGGCHCLLEGPEVPKELVATSDHTQLANARYQPKTISSP